MSKPVNGFYWDVCESPFGAITVCCSQKGLRQVMLDSARKVAAGSKGSQGARQKYAARQRTEKQAAMTGSPAGKSREPGAVLARQTVAQLREYASGRRTRFTVPLDLEGTPFQMKVWKSLCGIPYGETRSYQQVAREVGNPKAARAVGMANHWNPVAIIVPCHRVISSDGTLGGYGGGLQKKIQMLRLEGTTRQKSGLETH